MALIYCGITLAGTGAPVVFTADTTIFGWDVIVTASAAATITGANGVLMASLAAGIPFRFGGVRPVSGEPIRLSDYSATVAGGQSVNIAYAVRAT
jgi:hypothetical protein